MKKPAKKKETATAAEKRAAARAAQPSKASKAVIASKKLTPEEEAAERALVISDEAQKHANAITALQIDDVNAEKAAVSFRNEVIKAGIKQVKDVFDSIVKKAKDAYDEARHKRDGMLEPFEKADRLVLDALNGYYTRQKQRAREEQERADREQAARERQAVLDREKNRAQLEEQIMDQLAALPENAPQALIDKIQEPLLQFEEPVPIVPSVRVSAPETSGQMAQQDNWKGEVVNGHEMTVLKQIIAGELPMSIVEFRSPELNRLAKLYQDKTQFPGLRFWNEPFVRGVGGR